MKAIVIGGGIGGITTAIALRSKGIEAVAYERAPDIHQIQVGTGVFIWSNAMRALEQLGLDKSVAAAGSEITRFEVRSTGGRPLIRWDVGEMSRRIGFPTVGIARPDLHAALLAGLGKDGLVLGSACTGFVEDGEGVVARFGDGHEERADLLIAADGGRSHLRAQISGDDGPRYAGYVAYRGMVTEPLPILPPGHSVMYFGQGTSLFVYRVGRERPYWLAFVKSPPGVEEPMEGRRERLRRRVAGWDGPGEAVIAATDERAISRLEIADLFVSRWTKGRAALLGDAAHALSPNLGQGACQAIEDAVVLANLLAGATDVRAALKEYERRRKPRTRSLFMRAHLLGMVRNWESPFMCTMRNFMLGTWLHYIETWYHWHDVSYEAS